MRLMFGSAVLACLVLIQGQTMQAQVEGRPEFHADTWLVRGRAENDFNQRRIEAADSRLYASRALQGKTPLGFRVVSRAGDLKRNRRPRLFPPCGRGE